MRSYRQVVLLVAALVVGASALTACQSPKRKLGEGATTLAPMGESTLCREQPEHKLCQ